MDGKNSRRPSKSQSQNRKSQKAIRDLRSLPMPNLAAFSNSQQQQQHSRQHSHHQYLQQHKQQHPKSYTQQQQQQMSHQQQPSLTSRKPQGQDQGQGQTKIPILTRQQTEKCDTTKQPPAVHTDAKRIDTANASQVSDSNVNAVQMPVSEDQTPVLSSRRHRSLGREEQTRSSHRGDQNTLDQSKQNQAPPQSLPSLVSVMTDAGKHEAIASGSTSVVSGGPKSSRRSKSSGANGRRRGYHDNRGGAWWMYPPFMHPPPMGPFLEGLGRYHGVEETSKHTCLSSQFNPIMHNQSKQPRPQSFGNWGNTSEGRICPHNAGYQPARVCPQTHEKQRPFDISGSSLPELDMWMNGHRMEGSGHGPTPNHSWGLPDKNHYVGNGNTQPHCNNYRQEPKRRLSEVPPARHRKNAMRSPEYGHDVHPRNKNGLLDFERMRLEQDQTTEGFLLENGINRRSRFDQFLFSANIPPPPIINPNFKEPETVSQSATDTELPRSIGHILNNREKSVGKFRCHQRHTSKSPKRRGNKFDSRENHPSGVQSMHTNPNLHSENSEHETKRTKSRSNSNRFCNEDHTFSVSRPSDTDTACPHESHTNTTNNAVQMDPISVVSYKNTHNTYDFPHWYNNASSQDGYPQIEINSHQSHPQVEINYQSHPQVEINNYQSHPQVEINSHQSHPQVEINNYQSHPQVEINSHQSHTQVEINSHQSHPQVEINSHQSHPRVEINSHQSHPQVEINSHQSHFAATYGKQVAIRENNQERCFENSHPDLHPSSASMSEKPAAADSSRGLPEVNAPVSEQLSQLEISDAAPKRPQTSSVSDAEQDLEKMQKMGLPIKGTSKEKDNLNPRAQEFSTVCIKDGSGNPYTMTSQKGVCFFRPVTDAEYVSSDPRYVIQRDGHPGTDMNMADIVGHQMPSENFPGHVLNQVSTSVASEEDIERKTFTQTQQSQLFNHNDQQNNQYFQHTPQPQVHFNPQQLQQSEQHLPYMFPMMDQPFTPQPFAPLVPMPSPMFAFPGQVPFEMNGVTPPQEFQAPMAQSDLPQQGNFYEEKGTNHVTPGSLPVQTWTPQVTNVPDIPDAGHAIYNPPMFRFPNNCGMPSPPVTIPLGNMPFLNDQTPVPSPLVTHGMHGAFPYHGPIIYQSDTLIPKGFNPAVPVYHHQYDIDAQSKVEKTGQEGHQSLMVHHSPGLKSVSLNNAPGEDPGHSAEQNEKSLHEKVKETLQEVRQSLRGHSTRVSTVDKSLDSEDNPMLSVLLGEIMNKLAVINQLGNKTSLQRHIANSPEYLRPILELMLRFLCLLSGENTDLSSASLSKLVCLCRNLTSRVPQGLIQNLLNVLPEIGSHVQAQTQGTSYSGLEQLILKSLEEILANNHTDSSTINNDEPSSTAIEQNTPTPSTFDPSSVQQSEPQFTTGASITSPNCSNAESLPNNQHTCDVRNPSQSNTDVNLPAQKLEESQEKGVDLNINLTVQTENKPAKITSNEAESNNCSAPHKNDDIESASTAATVLDTETRSDTDVQSRDGTPPPIPRHCSVQRLSSCRSSQYTNNRSPACDKVDIASRIGVFERMRSKR